MKRLILVRHAKTEHYHYDRDFERKLTSRGKNDAAIVAEQLKTKDITPDYFISSPARRAKQTADIFAKTLSFPKEKISEQHFLYDGYTTNEFLNFISTLYNQHKTVIIFAHNPDIAMLASNLSDDDFFHFPTTATAVLDFDTDMWERLNPREGKVYLFLYPRIFKE